MDSIKAEPHVGADPSVDLTHGDDEVVAEIDVVLTNMDPGLSMYLVQHPLRPPWRPYDPEDLEQVRFKRQQSVLEMDYRFATETDEMDVDEQVEDGTTQVDSAGNEVKRKLKKHTIRSSVVPLRTNYAVGLYRGKKLFLTPLEGILQMRPSFLQLEDSEAKKKKQEAEMEEARQAESGGEFKAVALQVKRRETERAQAIRTKSYAFLKQQEMEDPFKAIEFIDRDREESLELFERIASTIGDSAVTFDVSRPDYLALINPGQKQLEEEERKSIEKEKQKREDAQAQSKDKTAPKQEAVHKLSSIGSARMLELGPQIRAIMYNCGIATYSTLRRLSTAKTDTELIKVLGECSVWVAGRWVVRSELVCKSDLQSARNALLAIWASDPQTIVNRRVHANTWRVDPDALKDVLVPIADLIPGEGWRLKLEPDGQPANLQEHLATVWNKHWKEVASSLDRHADTIIHRRDTRMFELAGASTFAGPRIAVEADDSRQLHSLFEQLLQNHGVLGLTFVKKMVQEKLSAREISTQVVISDDLLRQELATCAEPLHDIWVRKCNPAVKDDKYRLAIYKLFAAAKDRRIKRRDVEAAIVESTGQGIPRNTYHQIMKDLAFSQGTFWVLKPGDGTAGRSNPEEAPEQIDD